MMSLTPPEVVAVLRQFELADVYDQLFWRVQDDGTVALHASCSDFFHFATADGEAIEAGDLPLLTQTREDLEAIDAGYYLPELFAARKRRMRPLTENLLRIDHPAARQLFEACSTQDERRKQDDADANWWARVAHKLKNDRDENTEQDDRDSSEHLA